MSNPVSRTPPQGELLSYASGQPVSRGHGIRMVDDLGYLLGFVGAQPICNAEITRESSVGIDFPTELPVLYCRSPGVRSLLIVATFQGLAATLSVSSSSGSLAWIAQNRVDGLSELGGGVVTQLRWPKTVAYLDVTGLTVGTLVELRFTLGQASFLYGWKHLTICEVPLSQSNPVASPTSDIGLDAGWPDPSQPLIEGSSSDPRGIRRYVSQLASARAGFRRHIQSPRPDTNNLAWNSSSTTFSQKGRSIRVRGRRLYTTSDPNKCRFAVSYRTSDGTHSCEARLTDGTTTVDLTLPASTTRAVVSTPFDLTLSGTDQLADLTFYLRCPSGLATAYAPTWCLYDDEI